MLEFLRITTTSTKRGVIEIRPKFIIKKTSDLMIRGGDFYAIWCEDKGCWSTDEQDAIRLIDNELRMFVKEHKFDDSEIKVMYMEDSDSGSIDRWHKYCKDQMRDNYHLLDEKLIFANDKVNKKDYSSKKLSYPLQEGDISAYNNLISVLYDDEERHKIEWAIGSIVTGDSKKIQKFMVFYGSAGTGKSTILNIIQQLFEGYYSVFDAKALGTSTNAFALEAFNSNPLVAIQHDGDLSRIEDNTRLNSLVSHELMMVNEKYKKTYPSRFVCFLFMGTNKPVKITDGRSGLIRRLIDVSPTGKKIPTKEYNQLVKQIQFELGAIAWHCREVYLSDKHHYDNYMPKNMLSASNDFYNFIEESYISWRSDDGISLTAAWDIYKDYCLESKVPYPLQKRLFKEELKNYFWNYEDRATLEDGSRVRSWYSGFRMDKISQSEISEKSIQTNEQTWLNLKKQDSIFDDLAKTYLAQYASDQETPLKSWDRVNTTLQDLDTSKLHYVRVPENHIVIDFDIKDSEGNKCLEKNIEEAKNWPMTYAELSKSGQGLHLHYIYDGDVSKLNRVYKENVEVKIFSGKSSLRRKLVKCNDVKIATLNSGLPLKGEKVINFETIKSERSLRKLIERNLNKEIHPGTKPSVDFIFKILDDAYNSGLHYDVSDMTDAIVNFALGSTHRADYCMEMVSRMHFKSEESSKNFDDSSKEIAFFDVEVFPNLFVLVIKKRGKNYKCIEYINPKPHVIDKIMREFRLVGFNNRKYDNHILYARSQGYSESMLYNLSQKIINEHTGYFGEAYNISYTDIYDFSSKKQSLKKFEIDLGIHHQELGLPWNKPVDKSLWAKVAEYCCNDVIATEAVFEARQSDFIAREIISDVGEMTVNDINNSISTQIIFEGDKHPQTQFNYRDLGEVSDEDYVPEGFDEYTRFNKYGQPVFPGYEFHNGKSTYRGIEVGEGGRVFAMYGIHESVALLDIASMHPHSIIAENLFGDKYTKRFEEIVNGRIYVKHEDWDALNGILNGKMAKHVERVKKGELSAKDLATALKIVINSIYGLTAARFMNPFRDPRNIDNIVAKRGALFMINLQFEVEKRGFKVAHIKTDSIKIPDATPEIIQFVKDYGAMYGYTFEHEATYERMCLVNDAVYIAKYATPEQCEKYQNYIPDDNRKHSGQWTATGAQFAVPYVYKTLFSKEPIEFADLCETKSVSKGEIFIDMNENLPGVDEVEYNEKQLDKFLKLSANNDYRRYSREEIDNEITRLDDVISNAHNYIFVGRVGSFCPIKNGCDGGVLYRKADNKYYAVTGTKGYRWLEAEVVKNLKKEKDIDKSYYDNLVNSAVENISQYGDFEWFVSDDTYVRPKYIDGKPVYSYGANDGI